MLNAGQYGTSPLNLLLISLGCLLSPWDGWIDGSNVYCVVCSLRSGSPGVVLPKCKHLAISKERFKFMTVCKIIRYGS